MKPSKTFTCCCLLISIHCCAQEFSGKPTISVFVGIIDYQGDLNPNSFTFKHSNLTAGITFRKPINRWISARGGFNIGKIEAADRYNRDYLQPRNLSFYNTISEVNLGAELNVLDISTKYFTPYVYGGIALFHSNPWTYDNDGMKTFLQPLSTEGQGLYPEQKPYDLYQLALMFGGGFKLALSNSVNIGIEFSQRKSFTDYIDDVSTHYVDFDVLLQAKGAKAVELAYRGDELPGGMQAYPQHGEQRGTPSEMDWYYFIGTTFEIRISSIKRPAMNIHGAYSQRCPRIIGY